MEIQHLTVRKAQREDLPLIHALIQEFAFYEKRPQDMTGTEKQLLYWLFEREAATVLIAEYDKNAAGYVLYYPAFGSFSAAGKIHLEDIFIRPAFRGRGIGRYLLDRTAAYMLADGYTEMEWSCLDWNKPSLAFYEKLGAEQETGRRYFRFNQAKLEAMASSLRQDKHAEKQAD